MARKAKGRNDGDALQEQVLALVKRAGKAGITSQQLALRLGLKDKSQRYRVFDALDLLLEHGRIRSGKKGRFHAKDSQGGQEATGTISIIGSGAGYVRLDGDDGSRDVFVPERAVHTALHGDRVKLRLMRGRGDRTEGRVLEVLQRRRNDYVGVIHRRSGRAIMVPDDQRLQQVFAIPEDGLRNAKEGDKVIVELKDWTNAREAPQAQVTRVLGKAGTHEVEMHAILAEYGLPLEFPDAVLKEAEQISARPPDDRMSERRDLRDVTTLTIDPEDAKDLDDALSIRRLENGHWEVGVHIADVSHYVRPSSAIDQEALSRATSVYLVDRVVPMLPEVLSNDLCSLNADTDKLTFSILFELNDQASVVKEWIGRTVIRSDRRFAYAEAQAIIEGGDGPLKDEVLQLHCLAQVLRKDRLKAGALEIISNEVRFKLDDKGVPLEVYEKVMGEANWLIEEFMLLANKRVAAWVSGEKKKAAPPFVYRVHDLPDPEKVAQLRALAKSFGHDLSTKREEDLPHAINRLLGAIRGNEEEDIIRQVVIRTMAKAVYTTDNIGHFGLAFAHYTHFTSPIRRYPDLLVHRALAHYLAKGAPLDKEKLEVKCVHSSAMEKRAADAERASNKYKQAEYLLSRIGEVFSGTVSGITSWGVYVELDENHCEGMIPLRELRGDHYRFDDARYRLVGTRTGNTIRLGDPLTVKVRAVDMDRRQVDLLPVQE